MTQEEKLPWELTEEILSRVPPRSLVRFRTVSKQWNSLFNDKTFIDNNHKTTSRFILATNSKMYSVSINPKIEVCELDIPGLGSKIPKNLVDCNGIMFCGMDKETLVWNPWLNQTKRIKLHVDKYIRVGGIVYDDVNRRYKILAFCKEPHSIKFSWKIGEFDSGLWKSGELVSGSTQRGEDTTALHSQNPMTLGYKSVSLDGSLYWIASHTNISMFCVVVFDFSTERFRRYCDLPFGDNHHHDDALVLSVFKEDRFLLLKQCHVSKKIKIWVSKSKIVNGTVKM